MLWHSGMPLLCCKAALMGFTRRHAAPMLQGSIINSYRYQGGKRRLISFKGDSPCTLAVS